MIEIISAIIGTIAFPLYLLFVRYNTDALTTVESAKPKKNKVTKIIGWFCLAVCGGAIGWFVGKGLDKLWEVIMS